MGVTCSRCEMRRASVQLILFKLLHHFPVFFVVKACEPPSSSIGSIFLHFFFVSIIILSRCFLKDVRDLALFNEFEIVFGNEFEHFMAQLVDGESEEHVLANRRLSL